MSEDPRTIDDGEVPVVDIVEGVADALLAGRPTLVLLINEDEGGHNMKVYESASEPQVPTLSNMAIEYLICKFGKQTVIEILQRGPLGPDGEVQREQ